MALLPVPICLRAQVLGILRPWTTQLVAVIRSDYIIQLLALAARVRELGVMEWLVAIYSWFSYPLDLLQHALSGISAWIVPLHEGAASGCDLPRSVRVLPLTLVRPGVGYGHSG